MRMPCGRQLQREKLVATAHIVLDSHECTARLKVQKLHLVAGRGLPSRKWGSGKLTTPSFAKSCTRMLMYLPWQWYTGSYARIHAATAAGLGKQPDKVKNR